MKEQEIIEQIKNGDIQAFEKIYKQYKKKAMQMAYLMTGNQSMAMDITQEAFVECYMSLKKLKETAYFGTWFYKILTRAAWRYIKKEKRFIATEEIEKLIKEDEYSQNPYIQSDLSSFILSQINRMDYKKRTTLILYYYNELSIKEIAQVMGCYTGTVKSRLNSARRELKNYLEEEQERSREKGGEGYEMVTGTR